MGLFDLLQFSLSSLFYGVIATAPIMAILYFLLKLLSEGIVRSIPFYITGVILFILLSIQMSFMIWAMEVEDTLEAVEIRIEQIMEN